MRAGHNPGGIMKYKNIIFDVGEVLLGYRWFYLLELSGLSEEEGMRVGNEIFADPIWYNLDAGNVMLTEARALYREKYPEDADNIDFFLTHPELMPIKRPRVWEYLPKLKQKGYRLYILSNYGKELFEMHTDKAAFLPLMDGAVISYQVHLCKPNPEIYKALLDKYGLNPGECIFLDDKAENIEGAGKVGIYGVQMKNEDAVIKELKKLLEE